MIDTPCVIFAGGKSSRMGEDKSLLPFGDSPTLTQYQLLKLQKLFTHVYISCKDSSKFSFDANFIEDIGSNSIFAPTTGFVSIFKYLKDEERIFVISVDSPLISELEINTIFKSDKTTADATVAKTKEGIQPMCGIYHKSLEKEFKKMFIHNTHKLGYLLKKSNTTYVTFENSQSFLNLNNPKEYQEALLLI